MTRRVSLRDRALARAQVDLNGPRLVDDAPCWRWIGMIKPDGYGLIASGGGGGRPLRAHRVVYELLRGPIPDGLQLDHLCRVRDCVNPAHLEPVTCRVNLMRGATIAARNAAKTHCVNGHELAIEGARRRCRMCERERDRARGRAAQAS